MKHIILPIIPLLLFISCNDELGIPDTGRKIVINGLITTDSLLNVSIGKSAYITDSNAVFRMETTNISAERPEHEQPIPGIFSISTAEKRASAIFRT